MVGHPEPPNLVHDLPRSVLLITAIIIHAPFPHFFSIGKHLSSPFSGSEHPSGSASFINLMHASRDEENTAGKHVNASKRQDHPVVSYANLASFQPDYAFAKSMQESTRPRHKHIGTGYAGTSNQLIWGPRLVLSKSETPDSFAPASGSSVVGLRTPAVNRARRVAESVDGRKTERPYPAV